MKHLPTLSRRVRLLLDLVLLLALAAFWAILAQPSFTPQMAMERAIVYYHFGPGTVLRSGQIPPPEESDPMFLPVRFDEDAQYFLLRYQEWEALILCRRRDLLWHWQSPVFWRPDPEAPLTCVEAYGYLAGTYVRDKDAVVASMLICEMAAFYSKEGKSLVDVLNGLYEKYGYHLCTQASFAFEGEQGMANMAAIMKELSEHPAAEIGGVKVTLFNDYQAQVSTNCVTGEKTPIQLPKSAVLMYGLENGYKAVIRPSGTEPKIKIYYFIIEKTEEEARAAEKVLNENFTKLLRI